jgi:hypothetical protein
MSKILQEVFVLSLSIFVLIYTLLFGVFGVALLALFARKLITSFNEETLFVVLVACFVVFNAVLGLVGVNTQSRVVLVIYAFLQFIYFLLRLSFFFVNFFPCEYTMFFVLLNNWDLVVHLLVISATLFLVMSVDTSSSMASGSRKPIVKRNGQPKADDKDYYRKLFQQVA